MRVLIAKHLDVDVRHGTDDAHLSRHLGADWLDRLELIILVEEIVGVEITDNEADQIEVVGDLICYIRRGEVDFVPTLLVRTAGSQLRPPLIETRMGANRGGSGYLEGYLERIPWRV